MVIGWRWTTTLCKNKSCWTPDFDVISGSDYCPCFGILLMGSLNPVGVFSICMRGHPSCGNRLESSPHLRCFISARILVCYVWNRYRSKVSETFCCKHRISPRIMCQWFHCFQEPIRQKICAITRSSDTPILHLHYCQKPQIHVRVRPTVHT